MTGVCPRRNNAPGGPPDARLRRITTMFGHPWPGEYKPTLYARNRWELANDRDSLTGVIYPLSKLSEDDQGNLVADGNRSHEEEDWVIR